MADQQLKDITSKTPVAADFLYIQVAADDARGNITVGKVLDIIAGKVNVDVSGVSTMAANSIDSDNYVDGSIDVAHMSANSVDSAQYVDGSIDVAHMSANSVDSAQYVDGSIDLVHMSINSVDSDQYVDASIDLAHMSINSIDSDQYVDASIDLAHMSVNSIDSDQYVDGSIDVAHMSVNSIDSDQYIDASVDLAHLATATKEETWSFAMSDNTTALTTGTKFTWYTPYAITLTDIQASVLTAPTDATLIVDVHEAGTTIMATNKCEIETTEFHTNDATTQPVISDTALAAGAKIEFIVDQIGSSVAGAGLILYFVGYQT